MQVEGVEPGGVVSIVVDMGRASFRGEDVGFRPEPGDAFGHVLDLGDGLTARVNPVSIGNPHCVVFVDALSATTSCAARRIDPRLRGGNERPVRPRDRARHDRGLGLGARRGRDLASGSSACAAASAAAVGARRGAACGGAHAWGLAGCDPRSRRTRRLEGPAQIVYRGAVSEAVVRGWETRAGAAAETEEVR